MVGVLLVFSGYAWGVLHDIAALRRTPVVKPYLLTMSGLGHIVGVYTLARHSSRFDPPPALRALCFVLAPLGVAAMFYSIMVEIPFRKAWVDQGHTDELVDTGTYALARHPGVIWFTFAIVSLAVATRSRRMLLAAPLLIAGDVAHVAFQEQEVLVEVFGDSYREYQQRTPFLVPTVASFTRFLQTAYRPEAAPDA